MKKFYPIGTVVKVKSVITMGYIESVGNTQKKIERVIIKEPEIINKPFTGIIVGGAYVMEGEVGIGGHYDSDTHYAPEPNYLIVSKTLFVYLVRRGFTNKPLMVLPKDLNFENPLLAFYSSYSPRIPFRFSRKTERSEENKARLREDMKSVPRDAKGRWRKQVYRNGKLITI